MPERADFGEVPISHHFLEADSGSFRQIYVNEYGIDRPVSRGRELAVLAACTAGPYGLWADLHSRRWWIYAGRPTRLSNCS